MNTPRYFTLEQANAVVRAIRPMVTEILEIRRNILEKRPQFWAAMEKAAGRMAKIMSIIGMISMRDLQAASR